MAVKPRSYHESEAGQSLFEFLMLLPVLMGFTMILYRIHSAIQVSIVDQQYARAQALFLAFNNAYYPELDKQGLMRSNQLNQILLGVSDNLTTGDQYHPSATTQRIHRQGRPGGSDSPKEEPLLRGLVRVRNSVTLCAPSLFVQAGAGGLVQVLPMGPATSGFAAMGTYQLSEASNLGAYYCGSSLTYEQ